MFYLYSVLAEFCVLVSLSFNTLWIIVNMLTNSLAYFLETVFVKLSSAAIVSVWCSGFWCPVHKFLELRVTQTRRVTIQLLMMISLRTDKMPGE